MNVTLRHLRAFLAVASEGGFRTAAARLRIGQPALSLLVRDLEQEIGVTLFDRTTRRVEITAAGRDLRARVEKVMGDLDLALHDMRELGSRQRGRVVVCASPLLATVMLPNAIAAFRKRHPGVQVVLVDARTDQIVDKVRTGEADLGVGTFAEGEPGIDRVPLSQDRLMLFCDPRSDLARRTRVTWADLDGRDLITLTRESGIRLLVEVGLHAHKRQASPAYEVSQVTTAIALVEAGLGVAVLPTLARAGISNGAVVARPLDSPEITREIVAIRASGRSWSPAAESFVAVLKPLAAMLLEAGRASAGKTTRRV